jgi:hypothetical protein
VASEFKQDDKKPSEHHLQRQTGESQKGGNQKHNVRPSICGLAEITSGKYHASGNSNTSGNSNHSGTSNSKSGNYTKSSGGSRANLSPA